MVGCMKNNTTHLTLDNYDLGNEPTLTSSRIIKCLFLIIIKRIRDSFDKFKVFYSSTINHTWVNEMYRSIQCCWVQYLSHVHTVPNTWSAAAGSDNQA